MKLRRLMQNCPSRTKPTKGQRCASQQKLRDDVADGSFASIWAPMRVRLSPNFGHIGPLWHSSRSASSGREQLQRGNPLFDHDVGAQQEGFRDLQPDRLCRLEVDDQLEFRGLLNWNVFGMLAL